MAGDPEALRRVLQLKSYAKRLSFSRLDTHRTCPRRFWFQYIEKRPTKIGSLNLLFGSALHDAAEKLVAHVIRRGTFPSLDTVKDTFVNTWNTSIQEQVLESLSEEEVTHLLHTSSKTSLINSLARNKRLPFMVDHHLDGDVGLMQESDMKRIFDLWMHMGLDIVEQFYEREVKTITIPSAVDDALSSHNGKVEHIDAPLRSPVMAEKLFNMSIPRKVVFGAGVTDEQQESAVFHWLLDHGLEEDYKRHASFALTGFYDRVDRQILRNSDKQRRTGVDESTLVVEYKTQISRYSLSKNILQLKMYIYTLGLSSGKRPVGGEIVSFVTGQSVPYVTTDRDMDGLERYLHTSANDLLVDRQFEPRPSSTNCRFCPFRHICKHRHPGS